MHLISYQLGTWFSTFTFNCARNRKALQFHLVPPCILLFPFLTVHTGTTNERLPYIITPDHKFPRAALVFHVAR